MPNRYYSSAATQTSLASGITNVATTLVVGSTTGFPTSFPYTLILDQDTASEEAVTVSAAAGVSLTVIRGVDGTSAVAHSAGAAVVHGVTARDFAEPQAHMEATAAHGATGAVVGTTNTQTLSGKTLTAPTIADFTNATHDHSAANKGNKLLQVNTHQTPDTDTATTALHHTLGTGANQAAAGTHGHTDLTSGAWAAYTPTLSTGNFGNSTKTFRFKQVGKTVHVVGYVVFGSTTTFPSDFAISLPVTAEGTFTTLDVPIGVGRGRDVSTSTDQAGQVVLASNAYFNLYLANGDIWGNGGPTPWTWAASDTIGVSFTYEAA